MPRLLLVDDNPSIHKIAESLLAHSQIELVCAVSGQAALELVDSSSPFDIALVDISMAGMDGWELLDKLRAAPATARLPVALMAGVLDTVDPQRLAKAPIQGFLKKPVELRDLADRIQAIMDTPVPEATPEPEPEQAVAVELPCSPFETLPVQNLSDLQARLNTEDLLELTEEDLFPEEATPQIDPQASLDEELDLEELDLESLKELNLPESLAEHEATVEVAAVEAGDLPELPPETDIITVDDLPDFPDLEDESSRATQETAICVDPPVAEPEVEPLEELLESPFQEPEEVFPEVSLEERVAPTSPIVELPSASPVTMALEELLQEVEDISLEESVAPVAALPIAPIEELPPAASQEEPPAPVQAQETPGTQALVAAILANPALMSALASAVAAQLSDKALREVAWEIMPEIAERQKLL